MRRRSVRSSDSGSMRRLGALVAQGQIFFGFSPILKVFGSPLVNS